MKSILSLLAVCALATVVGCSNNKNTTASPGAVGENGKCSASCKESCATKTGASMGAVGEKKAGCCSGKTSCTTKEGQTNMGAVGEKTECTKTCPASGASMGAVGEKKSGCCASGKTNG